jgi:hypothetical protein
MGAGKNPQPPVAQIFFGDIPFSDDYEYQAPRSRHDGYAFFLAAYLRYSLRETPVHTPETS